MGLGTKKKLVRKIPEPIKTGTNSDDDRYRMWGWGSYGPLGAATRSPRRRRPLHFFRDLAFFGDSEDSSFAGHDDGRTTTKPGSPQTPFFERKIAKILSPIFFFEDFEKNDG